MTGQESEAAGTSPAVSVVMPVYNGAATLDRAIASVLSQTFTGWEMVAVDDGSSDDSFAKLQAWAELEPRVRVSRSAENLGPSAARNRAIEQSRGEFVAYLDCDDEYYPEFLRHVERFGHKGDLLFFGYDYVIEEANGVVKRRTWDPTPHAEYLFLNNLGAPLGVAHRRDVIEKVGGFDPLLWCLEDWDLWKRIARTGASVLYLPIKSGLYHVGADSRSKKPRLTKEQQTRLEANHQAGLPLYHTSERRSPARKVEKVLFASAYSPIDFSSGAAVATMNALRLLADQGFQCRAFGATKLDFGEEVCFEETLCQMGLEYLVERPHRGQTSLKRKRRKMTKDQVGSDGSFAGEESFAGAAGLDENSSGEASFAGAAGLDENSLRLRVLRTSVGKVQVTLGRTQFTRPGLFREGEIPALLNAYERLLEESKPDVLLTYGGDEVSTAMIRLAKRRDIPVVFGLHNLAYHDRAAFQEVDYVVVPSEFCKRHYWQKLGLHCLVLPYHVDWERVRVEEEEDPHTPAPLPRVRGRGDESALSPPKTGARG